VHAREYVDSIRTGQPAVMAESQGFDWDAELWPMVMSSNGGAVAASLEALKTGVSGSLSSGLHHARRSRGAGFCTFNGLAIAAAESLRDGAGKVLILDLDAHCGGGTASLVAGDSHVWQIDVSVSEFDQYESSERCTLDLVTDADEYLPTIIRRLWMLNDERLTFDLCIYNAGMDPHEGSSIGGLAGITHDILAERERIVFDWCRNRGLPIAFVLAGGYISDDFDEASLVALHRLTLEQAGQSR
jgi:acetoin utilization deacetylase AcuC-like enzyme